MQWKEVGIILSAKPFSERARIVTFFNKSLGKMSAIFKNIKTSVQKGDVCDIFWQGRSCESLGTIKIETVFSPFGHIFQNSEKVFAIDSVCSMCADALFMAAPHEKLFAAFMNFISSIMENNWIIGYIFFEISLLAEVGYGLDLSKCALTGARKGLCYVSPKTGRAVTKEAGWAYREKLLPLPAFMTSGNIDMITPNKYDIFCALNITGHFLKEYFCGISVKKKLPLSRKYLIDSVLGCSDRVENNDAAA